MQNQFDETFLAQLKQKQIYISDPRKFADDKSPRSIGVQVELKLPVDVDLMFPNFSVDLVSRRGVVTQVTDLCLEASNDSKILSFIVSQRVPDNVVLAHLDVLKLGMPKVATAFLDICWYVGIESIDQDYKPTCETQPKAGTVLGDLGWYLPARFIDPFVRAMGDLNAVFFDGALEEAMVYGVLYKESQPQGVVTDGIQTSEAQS